MLTLTLHCRGVCIRSWTRTVALRGRYATITPYRLEAVRGIKPRPWPYKGLMLSLHHTAVVLLRWLEHRPEAPEAPILPLYHRSDIWWEMSHPAVKFEGWSHSSPKWVSLLIGTPAKTCTWTQGSKGPDTSVILQECVYTISFSKYINLVVYNKT